MWRALVYAAVWGFPGQPAAWPLRFDFDESTQRWANQSPIDEHSVSEWTASCGRRGGGIHMRGEGGDPNQMRVWRKVIQGPPQKKRLRVHAWARGEGVENVVAVCMQAHSKGEDAPTGFATTQLDSALKGDFDWTEVTTVLDVPRGCDTVHVLLMLVGNGEAWFDDVTVEEAGEARLAAPGVFSVRGELEVAAAEATERGATLRLPMPRCDREQAPLTYELRVEPPGRAAGARVVVDELGNAVAEVELQGLTTSWETKVTWSSVVLIGPTESGTIPASVAYPAEWPEEAREWLRASRSVQSADERIMSISRGVRGSSDDVAGVIRGVLERARSIYEQEEGTCEAVDAVSVLEKHGGSAGCANVVAGLLRAAGIPARIVAGYPSWAGPVDTWFVVEAYMPGYGWYGIEPSLLKGAWGADKRVDVSVVSVKDEDESGARRSVQAGIGYMAVTEAEPRGSTVRMRGAVRLAGGAYEHECEPLVNLPEGVSRETWEGMLGRARGAWRGWLARNPNPIEEPAGERGLAERFGSMSGVEALERLSRE